MKLKVTKIVVHGAVIRNTLYAKLVNKYNYYIVAFEYKDGQPNTYILIGESLKATKELYEIHAGTKRIFNTELNKWVNVGEETPYSPASIMGVPYYYEYITYELETICFPKI